MANDLADRLGRTCQGQRYSDIIPAAGLLIAWSIFSGFETPEERVLATEALVDFLYIKLENLKAYTEKQEKEKQEHETANTA